MFGPKEWNFVAKRIRESDYWNMHTLGNYSVHIIERNVLAGIALDFAVRFEQDNPMFDPLTFLDHCSPDTDRYPLSELWKEHA